MGDGVVVGLVGSRVRGLVVGALLAVAGVVGVATPSSADSDEWRITRYDAEVTVGPDGSADVRVDFDFDFADEPGHGPFLTLPTRQAIQGDDEQDRLFRISDVAASSETAPDDLDVDTERSGVVLRIGDEDEEIEGVHTYTVTYRVDGWVNPAGTSLGAGGVPPEGDELYLNVLGTGWEIPLEDVSATVTGPADVEQAQCFTVEASDDGGACAEQDLTVEGRSAGFTLDRAEPGEPFTVLVVWPAGTFPDASPILGEKLDPLDPIRPTPLTGALALLVALGGGGLALARARRGGRDRAALGLPAGMVSGADRAFREHRPPVAIQSTPPADVRPGELGTLLDEVADPRDVTATIVDLAVRGFLEIREVAPSEASSTSRDGGGPGDWELVSRPDADRRRLLGFERRLLDDLFEGRDRVLMSEVRTTFSSSMAAVQQLLYEHVTEKGWFTANPRTVRNHWYVAGTALLVAGIIAGVVAIAALVEGLGLIAGALVLVGVLVLVLAKAAPARTASGTEVLAQAVAFKHYLETADADRLRLVHGEDLFSRYLPYAIVFGLAERWAGVFGDLAARGERVPEPTWYAGYGAMPYVYWGAGSGFGSSVDSFAAVATESISAATPASSGSSGTSGGFAGGGVGGGGGGGW